MVENFASPPFSFVVGFSRTLHTSVRSYFVWLCCVRRPNHFHNRQLDMKGHEKQERYQTPAFRARVSNESQVSHSHTVQGVWGAYSCWYGPCVCVGISKKRSFYFQWPTLRRKAWHLNIPDCSGFTLLNDYRTVYSTWNFLHPLLSICIQTTRLQTRLASIKLLLRKGTRPVFVSINLRTFIDDFISLSR